MYHKVLKTDASELEKVSLFNAGRLKSFLQKKKLKIHFFLSIFSRNAREKRNDRRRTFLYVTLESSEEDDEYLKVK